MIQQSAQPLELNSPPYHPSWVDQLLVWIDRLPLPAWVVYVLALLAMMLLNNARQWLDGTTPPGTIDVARITDAFYSVYFLALIHYLNRVARRAYTEFRPLLDVTPEESQRLAYELTVLPASSGYLALIAGGTLGIGGLLLDPLAFGLSAATSPASWVYVVVVTAFNTATLVAFVFHGIRQLRLVDQLHARASTVDLLSPAPLHAFAAVTARTGLGLVFFAWFMVVQDPTPGLNLVSAIGVTTLVLLGIASFVVPLIGMHRRLVAEKQRLVAEVGNRLNAIFALLHESVDTLELGQTDKIHQALASLKTERDIVEHLPTWPWRPETLRGFVTALILPILVWLLTRILEGVLGA